MLVSKRLRVPLFVIWPDPSVYRASNRVALASRDADLILFAVEQHIKPTQPFFHLEKKQGELRLTLGASFGRTLLALGVLLCIIFSGSSSGPASARQWTSLIKAAIATAKAIIP